MREDAAFDRPQLYGGPDGDYWDNAGRYALFCRAVLAALQALGERPDVIHAHDWQTALLPLYLRHRPDLAGPLAGTPSLLTVHNLAYQGDLPRCRAWRTPAYRQRLFHPQGVEYFGRVNLLKGGLLYADAITTVSPRYSDEIRTPAFGEGLDGVLRERAAVLHGILNGVDYERWNPETDPFLPARYSAAAPEGKARCKEALLQAFGLEGDPAVPLFATISRLADQKGFDLIAAAMPALAARGLRYCILGSGDRHYQDLFTGAGPRLPRAARRAHRLRRRAGAPDRGRRRLLPDALALRALRVEPDVQPALRDDPGRPGRGRAGRHRRALRPRPRDRHGLRLPRLRRQRPALGGRRGARPRSPGRQDWARLRANAMAADFSWEASARRYAELYRSLVTRGARRRG